MTTGDDNLPQSALGSFDPPDLPDLPDPPGPAYPQHIPEARDPDLFAAAGPSRDFDAFEEPATLVPPDAVLARSAVPEQPATPIRRWRRGGLCLYAAAGAAALVVLLCASLGVVALRASLSLAGVPHSAATNEANRIAILTRTGTGTPTPFPGATFAPMPNAVISFDGGAASTTTEPCNGLAPLSPVMLTLNNAHSTISVDWWMQITDTTPDGKLLWASGMPPYGTLPAGKSAVVEIDPDPILCTQLSKATNPVTYHATVFYGGVSGFTISVVVMPPGTGQQIALARAVSA